MMSTRIKIIPYGLILIAIFALVGFLGVTTQVVAEEFGSCKLPDGTTVQNRTKIDCEVNSKGIWTRNVDGNPLPPPGPRPTGTCIMTATNKTTGVQRQASMVHDITSEGCNLLAKETPTEIWTVGSWSQTGTEAPDPGAPGNGTAFETEVGKRSCGLGWITLGGSFSGCILQFVYWTFYTLGGWLLYVAAHLFNFLIEITLDSKLLRLDFVSDAWGIVRDLSNIFFILILLYIAIKTILGIGGSEVKKMIAHVVIIALLINFSMFMTNVVIDTSNIIALIFYNKVSAVRKIPGKDPTPAVDAAGRKDVAGGLTKSFNPTNKLDGKFFNNAGNVALPGEILIEGPVSNGTLIGITLIAGAIMIFAAYALFASGLSFLGRLIELFVLIIFSPFAFMSSTVPLLSGIEYLGWKAWFHRLLTVSFMAPIFMFFLYFIFKLVEANPFKDFASSTSDSMIVVLLSLIIPALVIMVLLMKAVEFAKKGAGKFGEAVTTGAKVIGGLALGAGLGAAAGGAAVLARGTVGRAGAAMTNSGWAKRWEARGWGGEYFRRSTATIGSGSFDVRGIKIAGKDLGSATGMSVGKVQEGGFTERRKAEVERRQKRAQDLEVGEDETLKQNLNRVEEDLQNLLNANSKELSELDKLIEKKRQNLTDVTARFGGGAPEAKQAGLDLQNIKDRRKSLRDGEDYLGDLDLNNNLVAGTGKDYSDRVATGRYTYTDANNVTHSVRRSINNMEDLEIRDRKQNIIDETRRRKRTYADTTQSGLGQAKDFLFSGGQHSFRGSREAAHKIRMEAKIEEKGGGGH